MARKIKAVKPRFRGYLHQEAFFVALGACSLLTLKSSDARSLVSSLVYSFGLLFLLGISALYHRPYWQPGARRVLKRFDHSAIFFLIAGTFTPIALLALPEAQGYRLLLIVWTAAVLGIFQSFFWATAPKWVTALLYVGMGWLALPYFGLMWPALGTLNLVFIGVGGIIYTVGAVFYATKRPRLAPATFGYHELFHLLTIFGAAFHFAVIYNLIR